MEIPVTTSPTWMLPELSIPLVDPDLFRSFATTTSEWKNGESNTVLALMYELVWFFTSSYLNKKDTNPFLDV
jgi:hypothetical protein